MKSAWKILAKTKAGTVSTGFYLSLFVIVCSEMLSKQSSLFIFLFQLQKHMVTCFLNRSPLKGYVSARVPTPAHTTKDCLCNISDHKVWGRYGSQSLVSYSCSYTGNVQIPWQRRGIEWGGSHSESAETGLWPCLLSLLSFQSCLHSLLSFQSFPVFLLPSEHANNELLFLGSLIPSLS